MSDHGDGFDLRLIAIHLSSGRSVKANDLSHRLFSTGMRKSTRASLREAIWIRG